jgi:hypothetical protein
MSRLILAELVERQEAVSSVEDVVAGGSCDRAGSGAAALSMNLIES